MDGIKQVYPVSDRYKENIEKVNKLIKSIKETALEVYEEPVSVRLTHGMLENKGVSFVVSTVTITSGKGVSLLVKCSEFHKYIDHAMMDICNKALLEILEEKMKRQLLIGKLDYKV